MRRARSGEARAGSLGSLASLAVLLCAAAGAARLGSGCSEPYGSSDAPGAPDASPDADSGPQPPGDATPPGDAGCTEAVCMTDLVAGGGFACALGDDRIVRCWGANDKGQTGSPDPATPTARARAVGGLGPVKQIAAGTRHACALQVDGKVLCWGDDESGLVSGTPSAAPRPSPVEIPGLLRPVEEIIGISGHQCARLEGGDLYCWGNNEYGQLGTPADGGLPPKNVPRPTLTLADVVQVGGAEQTTCALRKSGQVSCLGRNFSGQLGTGTSDTNAHPAATLVTGLISPVGQIASGTGYHVVVALADGRVQGWGSNTRNAILPTAGLFEVKTATPIPTITSAVEVAAGGYFTCVRRTVGRVACWGDNSGGQLGVPFDGAFNNDDPPREIEGTGAAERVVAGRAAFACVLASGAVLCWGNNDQGQLGRDAIGGSFPAPARIVR